MNVSAVFLAAGFATRLYPLTRSCAKPLLSVGGTPMLTRILRQVEAAAAVTRGVVVTNGRFSSDFEAWAAATPARLPLQIVNDGAEENATRLGAIRDLALGLDALGEPAPDAYLVLACDNLFDFPLAPLIERFQQTCDPQVIVRAVEDPVPPGRYSEVVVDGSRVVSFREKPQDPRSNLSAIAVYLLPPDLPELVERYLAAGNDPDAPGHFLAWLQPQRTLSAHRLTGRWWDIGSREDLDAADRAFTGS